MKLLNIFQRKQKSNDYYQNTPRGPQQNLSAWDREAFVDYLLGNGYHDLAVYTLLRYYDICAPLSDAVDQTVQEIQKIKPIILDVETGEFEHDHPVLDLLNKPNPVESYQSWAERMTMLYLVTGETYLLSTLGGNKLPLEVFVVNPMAINPLEGADGFVDSYWYQANANSIKFKRNEVNGTFRYYNQPVTQEIYQMKRLSRKGALTNVRGTSYLQSIYYEIEQYIKTSVHNLSILMRGGNPSGLITMKDDGFVLDPDSEERLREKVHNFYAGAENAGRIGFLNAPVDYTQLGSGGKDMDFVELRRDAEAMIYKRFNIPTPLFSEEVMTMANLDTARILFYDKAILPLADKIFAELTRALIYHYPDSESKIITYDISKIPVLEPRKLDQLAKLNTMGILSYNEQRKMLDFEDAPGADEILVPANLVPLATAGETTGDDAKSFASREQFVTLMQNQLNADGGRRYTDAEIEAIANQEGL